MMAFAPGRLSTTTGVSRRWLSLPAAWRASRSFAPPGGKPTIRRTGFVGYAAAKPGAAMARAAAASSTDSARRTSMPGRVVAGRVRVQKQLVRSADVGTHERLRELAVTRLERAQDLPVLLPGQALPLGECTRALAIDAKQVIQVTAQHFDDTFVAATAHDAFVEVE